MTAIYELENVVRRYGERVALQVPELTIGAGQIVGLVGPNGSGKSPLLRLLALLDSPDEGTLRFHGEDPWVSPEVSRREVTLLLQDAFLLKRSVFDNVAYGLQVRGERQDIKGKIAEAMSWVGLEPERFCRRKWYQLSGGEAQRVALAARLVLRPRVLLLDEPTASVDTLSGSLIQEAVMRARSEWGTTLVAVSHDLPWLYDVADELVALYGGKVTRRGPENLIAGPWQRQDDGFFLRHLSDGQTVLAPPSGSEVTVAGLDPSSIMVASGHPGTLSAQNALSGVVTQMVFENGSGKVLVKILCGGLPLTARVTRRALEQMKIHPGQDVWAVFKTSSLDWL
jgi:tungstate transport system ATP-binding protein